MTETINGSPVYLSPKELLKFSIFPAEAEHFKNVDMRDAAAVEFGLRSAGIHSQERTRRMQDMYDAGHIQNWELAQQKIEQP